MDLPAPFSPARPNTWPCWISRDTSCSAFVDPKLLEMLSTARNGDCMASIKFRLPENRQPEDTGWAPQR